MSHWKPKGKKRPKAWHRTIKQDQIFAQASELLDGAYTPVLRCPDWPSGWSTRSARCASAASMAGGWRRGCAVASFTEDEIRAVMAHHRPGNEGYCLCAWGLSMSSSDQEFTVDHLLDELKRDAEQIDG